MRKIVTKLSKIAQNPEQTKGHFRPRLSPVLAAILTGVILCAAPNAFSQNPNLPHLGEAVELSAGQEADIGQRLAAMLWRDPAYVDDAPLHAYVEGIWQPLLAAAATRGDVPEALRARFGWELLLGREASINAFALPGGWVGVHLGLIAAVGSRDELASVLAHELSHITQRHIARLHANQSRSTPLMLAGLILGALAAARSPDAGQALIVGSQAAAAQNYLGFSRDMEREADRVGFSVLEAAGFAPEGAMRMFARLQHASRLNDNGAWPYLRTHPLSGERMADMQTRAQQRGLAGILRVENSLEIKDEAHLEHALAAQRARVLTQPGPARLLQMAQSRPQPAASAAQRIVQLYGQALARAHLREKSQSLHEWKKLWALWQQHFGDNPQSQIGAARQILWLGAELQLENQNPQQALQILAQLDVLEKANAAATSTQNAISSARGLGGEKAENEQNNSKSGLVELGGFSENASGEVQFQMGEYAAGNNLNQSSNDSPLAKSAQTIAARPTLLLRTRALTAVGRGAEAADALQTWTATHSRDALAWQALAQAQESAGQMLAALYAQGEARAAQFDWAGAADRFTAAQDWARGLGARATAADHVQASIIDTRLRAMQRLLREQSRE